MKREWISELHKNFENSSCDHNGVDYWLARNLQELLGYTEWRNFINTIQKAKEACQNSGQEVQDHFVDINKMVGVGSGAQRKVEDIMLTRYACYLIAQNGDPKKDPIAFAQSYFAVQTRKQELVEDRLNLIERVQARKKLIETETELSKIIYERGVDSQGFGRIRSKGDQNNADVRQLLNKSGVKPEALPSEEDIKKLERRVTSSDKKLVINSKRLKIK
ncbi:MAG: DNA damage-inducible protein D [Candidatus Margulisbacteria bacterium]|nr:DNA damage-inducible protein D [Candidatus Margulisiibacteriota bacterium]